MTVEEPIVTVLTLSYNSIPFIEEAVASVLEQRVAFPIELLIADDASSDETLRTLRKLAASHPHVIRLLERASNVGMHANAADAWMRCKGRYVALLDADDYWTYGGKLAEQVAYLDAQSQATLVFHDTIGVDASGQPNGVRFPHTETVGFTFGHLMRENFISTSSVMYRRGVVAQLPHWFQRLKMADWPLALLHAQCGPMGYLPGDWAAYRMHHDAAWSQLGYARHLMHSAQAVQAFRDNVALSFQDAKAASVAVTDLWLRSGQQFARDGEYALARRMFARYARQRLNRRGMISAGELHAASRIVAPRIAARYLSEGIGGPGWPTT